MCGIAAISLSPSSTIPVRQLAHELLLHSEERGKVASGIGWWYGGNPLYMKDGKPGGHLPLKVLPKDARSVIVHTRNATYGDPADNENNHPVTDPGEEIILVHNGVISNHDAIRTGEKETAFPEVDSSVIPFLIQKEGTQGLMHLDGWAALAWLDKLEPDMINLSRLKGNAPMVIVYLKDGSIVMGSTFPIIHAALIRVGYGDAIVQGYEVPDHTHIRVKHGTVNLMTNVTPYKYADTRYKGGKHLSQAERARLEKITNGDAVSYGKDNPVHQPPPATTYGGTAYQTGSGQYGTKPPVVGGGSAASKPTTTPPAASAGTSTGSAGASSGKGVPALPPVAAKSEKYKATGDGPKVDPLKGFKAPKPLPPSTHTTYVGGASSQGGTVTPINGKKPGFPTPQQHPIQRYLEARLTYWIDYVNTDGTIIREVDPFIMSDYEDDGYLYNAFVDMTNEGQQGGFIGKWGVFGPGGKALSSDHFTTVAGEAASLEAIAKTLPPVERGRRKTPSLEDFQDRYSSFIDENDDTPDEPRNDVLGNEGGPKGSEDRPKAMWDMTEDEWREQFSHWSGVVD